VDRKPKASFVFDFVTDQALRPELIRIRFLSRIGRMKKKACSDGRPFGIRLRQVNRSNAGLSLSAMRSARAD